MKRSHGKYSGKSRNLVGKGKMPPAKLLAKFEAGEKVRISINPRYSKGMPHLRFNRKMAQVIGMQGNAVVVRVKDINKAKTLMISNVHLARIEKEAGPKIAGKS